MNNDSDSDNDNDNDNSKNKDNYSILKALSLLTQLGLNMASCVVIGFFLGRFLDWLFGTNPVFMIIFVFVGAAAAIKIIYDIAKDWK